MIDAFLQQFIGSYKQKGLYRERMLADRECIGLNFSSNDYLSLRNDKRIQAAFQKGFANYPAGSGASMVVCGYHSIHQELEQTVAKALGVEKALLFSSGYAANLALMAFLAKLPLTLLLDKAVHASIYDGLRLSRANYTRFLHNNRQDLQEKIGLSQNSLIITEGLFSMSGQQPDLRAFVDLAGHLVVDEAHAFGVLGPNGLGATALYGLTEATVPLRVLAFGKAMGAQGAIIAGKGAWIEGLLQCARSYIYSTGMSPALAYGLLESFLLILQLEDRRKKLQELVAYFQAATAKSPLPWRNSHTPIQQLRLGSTNQALRVAKELQKQHIYCLPMRPPTVSLADTGLRVVLNYHHEASDIDALFHHLHAIYET